MWSANALAFFLTRGFLLFPLVPLVSSLSFRPLSPSRLPHAHPWLRLVPPPGRRGTSVPFFVPCLLPLPPTWHLRPLVGREARVGVRISGASFLLPHGRFPLSLLRMCLLLSPWARTFLAWILLPFLSGAWGWLSVTFLPRISLPWSTIFFGPITRWSISSLMSTNVPRASFRTWTCILLGLPARIIPWPGGEQGPQRPGDSSWRHALPSLSLPLPRLLSSKMSRAWSIGARGRSFFSSCGAFVPGGYTMSVMRFLIPETMECLRTGSAFSLWGFVGISIQAPFSFLPQFRPFLSLILSLPTTL